MCKILFLCGYFENDYQDEIQKKTKTFVENAANLFQERLIEGLVHENRDVTIVSAPFIGAWPNAYCDMSFKGFSKKYRKERNIKYVKFNNIWGIRNFSRTAALKKEVDSFLRTYPKEKKIVIVYSPHTPLVEAAVYAKLKAESVHICLVVPDLPQYMNLSKSRHLIYDFFKKIDIRRFKKLNKYVDSYMILTEHMASKLNIGKRPYIVVEGITKLQQRIEYKSDSDVKRIAFAGKLNESFGAKRLVQAFELIKDPNIRLDICGGGELKKYMEDISKKDRRVHYYGVVTSEEAFSILQKADILVNPRTNNEEYTKYSFPSKNVEYLMTGNTVIAYMLDGIPKEYSEFFLVPEDESIEALSDTIKKALCEDKVCRQRRSTLALEYLRENRTSEAVVKKILNMIQYADLNE